MANVIYRDGPYVQAPKTVTGKLGAALLPGTAVGFENGTLSALSAAGNKRVLVLMNRDFFTQTTEEAYEAGGTGAAYQPRLEDTFSMRMAAGTYNDGDPLMVAGGQLTAATSGKRVFAFYAGEAGNVANGALADVIIAGGFAAE